MMTLSWHLQTGYSTMDDATIETPFVGPETTLTVEIPGDDHEPWWVSALSALVSGFVGATLAIITLYYLFAWWISA